jgi:hypothetical protein
MKTILFFSLIFAVLQLNAQVTDGLIQYYDFNNSYNNSTQTNAFGNNAGTSFVEGYNGQANGALNINNTGSNAIIPDLPYGTEARSVSLWVKFNQHAGSGYGMLFSYGTATQSNAFSGCAGAEWVQFFGYNDGFETYSPTAINEWNHFVFNFDGSVARVYKNGVLIDSETMSNWNTLNDNDIFKLGTGPGGEVDWFNGAIDELKIYDRAKTAEEVVLLYEYQGSSASIDKIKTSDFNIYPNPATASVSLNNLEIGQTITLFDVRGKIVFSTQATSSTPTLDVSTLGSGIYFVQVQQNGVLIGTQKLQVQ